jgi:catechol 2,3-dioxygenase-like lactoylglutathione lyase family enzyme
VCYGRPAMPKSAVIATRGLRHVALRVRDLRRAKAFYSEVFGMDPVWEPDPQNCYLSSGCDNLALHEAADLSLAAPHQPLDHIGFIVTSADAVWTAAAALEAHGVPIVKEPRQHRDGSCSLYCTDPDGNLIQVLFEPSISPLAFE